MAARREDGGSSCCVSVGVRARACAHARCGVWRGTRVGCVRWVWAWWVRFCLCAMSERDVVMRHLFGQDVVSVVAHGKEDKDEGTTRRRRLPSASSA